MEEGRSQSLQSTIKSDNNLGTSHDIYTHKATAPDSRGETMFINPFTLARPSSQPQAVAGVGEEISGFAGVKG